MVREKVLFKGEMSPDKFEAHFNHAFGKEIRNKRELKNEIAMHNGLHGTDLQEVGNDIPRSRKPEYKPDYDSMGRELYKMRRK